MSFKNNIDIKIRKMFKSDLPFFNEVRNHSYMFLHDKNDYTLEDNIEWFKSLKTPFFIVEIEKESIGYFRTSNWVNDTLYIGMDIHKKYRGLGYSTPSYVKFIKLLKDKFNINTIFLEVLTSNKRAINIYNKLDFTIIGVEPHDEVDKTIKMKLEL